MQAIQITTAPTLISPRDVIGQHNIYNDSDETIYVSIDGDDQVTPSTGIPIAAGAHWIHEPQVFSRGYAPAIYAVHGGSGNKAIRYGVT